MKMAYAKTYQHPRIFKYSSYVMIFANTDSHLLIIFDISNLTQCPMHQSGYLQFNVYHLRPGFSTPNMTSCVPRLVRNCVSCIKNMGVEIDQQSEGSYTVLLYFNSYVHIQNC